MGSAQARWCSGKARLQGWRDPGAGAVGMPDYRLCGMSLEAGTTSPVAAAAVRPGSPATVPGGAFLGDAVACRVEHNEATGTLARACRLQTGFL